MSRAAAIPPQHGSRTREVLANSSFRRLWAIGGASTAMRWLDTVAVGAFVFQLTGSPFDVALTFFFRTIPMFALGAYIGAVSDRLNRRILLMSAFGTLSVVYVLLAIAVSTDVIQVWHIYLGALLAGGVWATDFPVRWCASRLINLGLQPSEPCCFRHSMDSVPTRGQRCVDSTRTVPKEKSVRSPRRATSSCRPASPAVL